MAFLIAVPKLKVNLDLDEKSENESLIFRKTKKKDFGVDNFSSEYHQDKGGVMILRLQ